ncbi:MAG: RHS repeat-associated core domain-containing protein, partial [Steroidobacteraceae bacterium]|nr:RHS repeat-associated core domain-containing protein [Steroidobacteraceae bacterium]
GGVTEFRHLINGTPGTVAMHTRRSSGTNDTYYLHRDHLGSAELITNAAGTSVVKLSFSAYGERRDTDWDGSISAADLTTLGNTTRHGYTDHEHLDSVGLIHMGGRVYDPVIGRFLSRDPYIDGVQNSQGANGYAYVWNNPLTRWDPTGYGGQADGPDVRTACNPDCPQNWRDGVGARLSNAFVSCFGNCPTGVGYANEGSWIDYQVRSMEGIGLGVNGNWIEALEVSSKRSAWAWSSYGGAAIGFGSAAIGTLGDSGVVATGLGAVDSAESSSPAADLTAAYGHSAQIGGFAGDIAALTAGKTRIGSNGRVYYETARGRVFYGNGSVTTYSVARIGKLVGAGAIGFGIGLDYMAYRSGNLSGQTLLLNAGVALAAFGIGGPGGLALATTYYLGSAYLTVQGEGSVLDSYHAGK